MKVLAVLARSIREPRLRIQNDGEHSTVEVVRQTCDECKLSVEKFPTRRGWPERVLSTEPEERSKCDFAVYKDCAGEIQNLTCGNFDPSGDMECG